LERRWWALIAVCGARFALLVDIFIVQVALPTIHTVWVGPSPTCSGCSTRTP
jgi:hypothetical protein